GGAREALLRIESGTVRLSDEGAFPLFHVLPSGAGTTTLEMAPGGVLNLNDLSDAVLEDGTRLWMRGGSIVQAGWGAITQMCVNGDLDWESGSIYTWSFGFGGRPVVLGTGAHITVDADFYAENLTIAGGEVRSEDDAH